MRSFTFLPFALILTRVVYAAGEDGDDGSEWIPDGIEAGVDDIQSGWDDFTDAAAGAVTTLTSDGQPYWASVTSLADGAKSTVVSKLEDAGILSAADSAIDEGKSYAGDAASAAKSAYESATADDDNDEKGNNSEGKSGEDGDSSSDEDSGAQAAMAPLVAICAGLVGSTLIAA